MMMTMTRMTERKCHLQEARPRLRKKLELDGKLNTIKLKKQVLKLKRYADLILKKESRS